MGCAPRFISFIGTANAPINCVALLSSWNGVAPAEWSTSNSTSLSILLSDDSEGDNIKLTLTCDDGAYSVKRRTREGWRGEHLQEHHQPGISAFAHITSYSRPLR